MIPRDRVEATFEHKEPDMLAMDLGGRVSTFSVPLYADFLKRAGFPELEAHSQDLKGNIALVDEEILEKFGIDTRYVTAAPPDTWQLEITRDETGESLVDEWGATYRMPRDGFYFDLVEHPFPKADIAAIDHYDWPDPDNASRYRGLRDKARGYHERGYIVGTTVKGAWETMWVLRGIQQTMRDIYRNSEFYHVLARRAGEVMSAITRNILRETSPYVQYVCVTCDVGTQNNIMISKEHFDTFIRPYESMIFDAIRDGGAKVALHSCGAVFEMVPQIIDCGVDILNPIQTSASGMDTRKLKQEFGRDLCFWGGIDVQQVLRSGTVDEVRQETRRVIEDLSPGGGYLFAPSHDIQTGTPLDNVMAMFETAREIGGRH